METQPSIDRQAIADDFEKHLDGKLEPEKIQAARTLIAESTQKYPAKGSVASFIFYLKFQVNVEGGKSFNGNGGGISSPGGGALIGDVYTSDLNKLYADTVSFQFTVTSVYASLIFFDKDSHALGTFQAGSVSTVNGVGGGSGKWS